MGKQLKTFKSEFIDKQKKILIPLLQRDYVQGGRLEVISPLLDELISALSTADKTVNLNYIYGYDHENKFVPIDGQQRLITLWLLHLYIYARLQKDFKVGLQFESREFAHYFCEKLPEKLGNFLKEKRQEKESDSSKKQSLKEKIVDSDWFVFGWQQDATVENMLKTLQLIDDKLRGKVIGTVHEDNIGFDFNELKNGLDDDIYVKMNGRGRPLSYFENLKSWMDKQVQTLFGKEDDFTKQWQSKMDNDWTDLFWYNRNKNEEKPEEIDDERMRFLYSMLLLFWIQDDNSSCFLESFCVNEGESQDDVKSGYIAFLNEWRREEDKLPDNASAEQLRERTFSLLQKGDKMIPLYWFEKINIFGNEKVFEFISKSLDTLVSVNEKINGICKDFVKSLDFDDKSSVLYQLAFKDATYNKTLPLLYALVKTPETLRITDIDVLRWIRLWRNLVTNSSITSKNLNDVCRTICEMAKKSEKDDLYQILKNWQWQEKMGFAKAQVNEEIAKAKQILDGEHRSDEKSWEIIIFDAENYAFFKGAIRFLFTDEFGNVNEKSWGFFDQKWNNIKSLIPEKKDDRHTIKLLIPYLKDTVLRDVFSKRYLSNEDNNLKMLLLDFSSLVHEYLMNQIYTQGNTLLQKDLILLCEKFPDFWIHKNWIDNKDVLSNYSNRYGYYETESFFIGNSSLSDQLNILLQSNDSIEIDNNRIITEINGDHQIWKGLFIKFKYSKYTFHLKPNNQVDMYDESGLNMKKGLCFTGKEPFKTFLDYLISEADK